LHFIISGLQIVLIDLLLAGDNALIIAMAVRSLPPKERRIGIICGAGAAVLLRNDGGNRNHWLNVRLSGTKANRDGIGAVVRIESASGKQWHTVRSGSSYCSQSDLALTFGLGSDPQVTSLEIQWPSGTKQKLTNIAANQFITVDEEKGIVAKSGPSKN